MKKNILKFLLLGLMFLSAAAFAADKGTLDVYVSGFKNDDGVARIAIFNTAAGYNRPGTDAEHAYQKATLRIKNGQAVWHLKDLPYGYYAVKVYHDADNSGDLTKNFLEIPKEGYGFSNNPNVSSGPASFKQAVFYVKQPSQQISIQIVHR